MCFLKDSSTECRKAYEEKFLSFPEPCPPPPHRGLLRERLLCYLLSFLRLPGSPPVLFLSALCLFLSDFDLWASSDCEQNKSEPIPANCTGCAQILPLKVTLPEDTPKTFERLRPLVIKVGKKPGFPMGSLPIKDWIKPYRAMVPNCDLLCHQDRTASVACRDSAVLMPVPGSHRGLHRGLFHQVVALLS